MNKYIDIIFPSTLTRGSPFSNKLSSILGPSYMIFKSVEDKVIISYVSSTSVFTYLDKAALTTSDNILNVGLINNIKTKVINNRVKLYMKGLLISDDNSACINTRLILDIPNSNDPNITYQQRLSIRKLQGTLICNYTFNNNVLLIVAIYFTLVRNPYFDLEATPIAIPI